MACNAWNHPDDCRCDFRGGHANTRTPKPARAWRPGRSTSLDRYTVPTARCPDFKARVFFLPFSNGGCAYLDALGPPWPKHPCQTDRHGYTPYYADGRPRLTSKLSDWQVAGWLPLSATSIEAEGTLLVVRGYVLDEPAAIIAAFEAPNDVDPNNPILVRRLVDDRVELSYSSRSSGYFKTLSGRLNCDTPLEYRLRSGSGAV